MAHILPDRRHHRPDGGVDRQTLTFRALIYNNQNNMVEQRLMTVLDVQDAIDRVKRINIRKMSYCDLLLVTEKNEWGEWQGTIDSQGYTPREFIRRRIR